MPLPLPNLDDRTYDDLLQEAIAQIPIEYPEWTDHNPSDTGIILLELFAWLTEMTLYQVNQIPDRHIEQFLVLLKGEAWFLTIPDGMTREQALNQEIRNTILTLRQRYRAVTLDDYNQLILQDWNDRLDPSQAAFTIHRVQCLPQQNLQDLDAATTAAPGHISLVIVPNGYPDARPANLQEQLNDWLEPRRLLTTHHHVVYPRDVSMWLHADIYLIDGSEPRQVNQAIGQTLTQFFHPLDSGTYWQGQGWPFGRSVYVSELYQVLSQIPGISHVDRVELYSNTGQMTTTLNGEATAGTKNIEVSDASGFAPGDRLQLGTDGKTYEVAAVDDNTLSLEPPISTVPGETPVTNLSQISLAAFELVRIDLENCQFNLKEWSVDEWRSVSI